MTIQPYFYTPNLMDLDIASRVEEQIHETTDKFKKFCIGVTGPDLKNDALKPHLQKILQLCISETDASLETHQQNIHTILKKVPEFLEVYMATVQILKEIQPDLFKLNQKSADDPDLLKMHVHMMQNITKLETPMPLLEIYLRSIEKLKNASSHTLGRYICGLFTSHLNLIQDPILQNFFFLTIHTMWDLKIGSTDVFLENLSIICNSKKQLLEHYLLMSSVICHLEPIALEVHLNNINTIKLPFLEKYINTLCDIKNDAALLKFYIYTISILKGSFSLLEIHQKNIQNICRHPFRILKAYLKIILQLESSETLLKRYIQSTLKINYTKNIQSLELHFKNADHIHRFHPKLLERYLQNIDHLNSLHHYIQTVHDEESYQDKACIIFHEHNLTYISHSQPELLNLYSTARQALKNKQRNLFFYTYDTYFVLQEHPETLKKYFNTILCLENTHSNPLPLCLEKIHSKPDPLVQYISKILAIEVNEEFPSPFYTSSFYIASLITQKHPELINLYKTSYKILESKQEDLLCHLRNVFYISQKYPHLLQKHLEIVLFLTNTPSNLLWPYLKNIENNYGSDPSFFDKYIFKISDLKNHPELLVMHICNTFNIHRINTQHPLLLKLYNILENNPKSTSYHMYNTYRISIMLTEHLKPYLETIQQIAHIPKNDANWIHLNAHLQNIQECTFEDSTKLQKHLQSILQIANFFKGKMFFIEEIIKNMKEEEKKEFKSISYKIMPYVIAKTLFLYVFHERYNQLDPCFFSSETKQESEIKQQIRNLRKEACKYTPLELDKIFKGLINFDNYQAETPIEEKMKTTFIKIQNLWIDGAIGENNLFIQCWKQAANTLP